jgi:uncharacterized OsmC-like protein
MAVKAKVIEHGLALDREGRVALDGGDPQAVDPEWTPEHLVLAGLARCSLASLRYYAKQRGIEADGSATVASRITRREDGSYGFVAIDVSLDVTLAPEPADLGELLEKARWGCFIGASLDPKPTYTWRVNGEDVG